MAYTNLNINNMVVEIEKHLKNIKNKEYIKDVIINNYNYNLITKNERDYLYNKYKEMK